MAAFARISSLAAAPARQPTFLAVGVFDGVHLGHQQLLREMVAAAQATGARAAVLTFFPHPAVVIRGLQGRLYLTSLEERVALLAALGVELVVTLPFDERLRLTSATEFVDALLQALDVRQFWGGSFSLGHNREGNAPFLRALGAERGFSVHQVTRLVSWRDKPVSSSRIRRGLEAGDLEEVNGCLGRHFSLKGRVMAGRKLGRTIGFPTANLSLWEEQMMPANGVYFTLATVRGQQIPAASNIGIRPTVDGSSLTVEAHLLDFDQDIYGEELSLAFVQRLRPERRFDGLPALTAQIQIDVAQIRQRLAAGSPR